jgi:acetoin utilization deacetylase AcuC-like enzyme
MLLSVEGYARIMRTLAALANTYCKGRLVLTLEGGYNLQALAHGVAATFSTLLGDPSVSDSLGPARDPEQAVAGVIQSVKRAHSIDHEHSA